MSAAPSAAVDEDDGGGFLIGSVGVFNSGVGFNSGVRWVDPEFKFFFVGGAVGKFLCVVEYADHVG